MGMTPVGSTARWLAARRALETESANPLFRDPFARGLAGEARFAMLAAMRGPDRPQGLKDAAAAEQAAIAVERATGPLLLVSGGDDQHVSSQFSVLSFQ